jgi:hypothetical protein
MDSQTNHMTSYIRQSNMAEGQAELLSKPQDTVHQRHHALSKGRRLLFLQTWFQFLVVLLASALFATTTWFARGKFGWTTVKCPGSIAIADGAPLE